MSVNDKQQKLLQAWRNRKLKEFKTILKDDANVDPNFIYTDENYVTLLHLIASDNFEDSKLYAECLLSSGARPSQVNRVNGRTALHEAAAHVNYSVLNTLLCHGVDCNIRDSAGNTALHYLAGLVCSGKQLEWQMACVDLLVSKTGLDVNQKNSKGLCPLAIACDKGAKHFISKLLEQGSRLDVDSGVKPLRQEIASKFPDLASDLPPIPQPEWMHVKMDGNKFFTLLQAGEQERFCDAFRREMEDKSKHGLLTFTDGQQTFLQYGAEHGLHLVLSEVLRYGGQPDVTPAGGKRPLHLACFQGDATSVEILIKGGAQLDPDENGETPLHVAARYGHLNLIELIVKAGAKIEAKDKCGRSALHVAARCGHQKCCRRLLELGAYFGSVDLFGESVAKVISTKILEEFMDSKISSRNRGSDDYRLYFDFRFIDPNFGQSANPEMVSLTQGISKYPKSYSVECKPILELSKSSSRTILAHPVLASFAACKFYLIKMLFYLQLLLSIIFVLCVTAYTLLGYQRPENDYPFYIVALQLLLGIFVGWRFLCSLIPIIAKPLKYISRIESWVDLTINILVIIIVAKDCPRENLPENLVNKCPTLSAIAVLLTWMQFTYLVSQHPSIAKFRLLFCRFSLKAVQIIACFTFLFFAFPISLHLLVQNCSKCSVIFENLGSSLYHVLVIAAGDVSSEATPTSSPGVAHLIFLTCLFFMVILLSNLLVGVVVYETLQVYDEGLVPIVEAQILVASKIEQNFEDLRFISRHIRILFKFPGRYFRLFCDRIFFFAQSDSIAVLPHDYNRVDFENLKSKSQPKVSLNCAIVQTAEAILRGKEEIKVQTESKVVPVLKETSSPEPEKVAEEINESNEEQMMRYLQTFMTRLDTLEQYGKQTENLLIKILEIYSVNQANNENR